MLQWFIRFLEFAEFTEFLIHLGETPMTLNPTQSIGVKNLLSQSYRVNSQYVLKVNLSMNKCQFKDRLTTTSMYMLELDIFYNMKFISHFLTSTPSNDYFQHPSMSGAVCEYSTWK